MGTNSAHSPESLDFEESIGPKIGPDSVQLAG